MRAVLYRVRVWLRRRWPSALAVVAVVAVATAAVLTIAAGARRTAAAPDAYTAAAGGDADTALEQLEGLPLADEIAALPGVASVNSYTFLFAGIAPEVATKTFTLAFAGDRPFATRLVAGREADPTRPHEFIADEVFAAEHDANIGDTFPVVTWTREQGDTGQGFNAEPLGPSFEAELVGIVDSASVLEIEFSEAVFSKALLDDDIGISASQIAIDLEPGMTVSEFRAALDTLPNGQRLSLESGTVVSEEVRNAVSTQARGLWVMALVAALATVIAIGQLLTRFTRLPEAERQPLVAMGTTNRAVIAESVARAVIPAAAGVVVGAVVAVLFSDVFPTGFARALEPDHGRQFDVPVLGLGGLALLAALLGWVGAALIASRSTRARRSSVATDAIARHAPGAAAATGTRFALTGREGSSRAAFANLLVLTVIATGFVGATAFAVGLDRLVTDRARFGSNFTFSVGDNSGFGPAELRTALENEPGIDGLMILSAATARSGDDTVELVAFEPVKGGLAPRIVSGREPVRVDELALGGVTARRLDLHVGDALELAGRSGTATFGVVGIAVVPTIAGNDGVGLGAVLRSDALARLESEPDAHMAAIDLAPDAPSDIDRRIATTLEVAPGEQDLPAPVQNLFRVRRTPAVLAVLLGGLALLTLIHALIVSIQHRRRDLAVLRALGADRGWLARTVHWQASTLTVLPLLVAVPLGLLVAAVLYRAFANQIGAWPTPSFPYAAIVAMALGFVALANVVAAVPARRARRLSASRQLQRE